MRDLRSQFQFCFVIAMLSCFVAVSAFSAEFNEEFEHPGYLDSVEGERDQISREVVIVPPLLTQETNLYDRIFTSKLSREFSTEFRYRFGHTEFEQISFVFNPRIEMGGTTTPLISADDYIEQQEQFGQYIAKELTEYHVNNYLKGNPKTREVYKVKERITNAEFKAGNSGYKFKYRYRLSANRIILRLEKPNQKLHPEMNLTPSGNLSPTLRIGYDVTKTINVRTDYQVEENILSVQGRKQLTASLSTSLTGQNYGKNLNESLPKQQRILLGLSWND